MKITYQELSKNLKDKNFSNIYFLAGSEKFLIQNFEKKIVQEILGEKPSDFDLKTLEFETLETEKFSLALETPPLCSPKKCVVIKNFGGDNPSEQIFEDILEILKDIPEFSVVIFSEGEKKLSEKAKKIKDHASKNGSFINFSSKDVPLQKLLIGWAKKMGKILNPYEAAFMEKAFGQDLSTLKHEIKKICTLESQDIISKETIESFSSGINRAGIFDLNKAVLAKNYAESFKKLEALLDQKETPIAVLSTMASGFVDIARIKTADLTKIGKETLKTFFDYKNKEFRIDIAERHARNMTPEKIKDKLKILIDADLKLKSSSLSASIILSEAAAKLIY